MYVYLIPFLPPLNNPGQNPGIIVHGINNNSYFQQQLTAIAIKSIVQSII